MKNSLLFSVGLKLYSSNLMLVLLCLVIYWVWVRVGCLLLFGLMIISRLCRFMVMFLVLGGNVIVD